MNSEINLDNNYYLEVSNNVDKYAIDIQNLTIKKIKAKPYLVLKIDFNTFSKEAYKRIIKRFLMIIKIASIYNIELGKKRSHKKQIGFLIHYDRKNKKHNDFISAINAALYPSRYARYNYIYDTVCDYLDSCFYGKNLCDFQDNKCGEKKNTSSTWGCCRHYKYKLLGPLSKFVLCEHLQEDYSCDAKCISCKLFTCDYLRKKGVQFKIKDILLLDIFFNSLQKYFIKYMVFTPKEKIIQRLMIL